MTTKIGIRELVRNTDILDRYDYVEIEDKRTHRLKGLFVSPKYAETFRKFLQERITKEQQKKLDRIHRYAGSGKVKEEFNRLNTHQIREKIAREKDETN